MAETQFKDPKTEYIQSLEPISTRKLVEKYKGQKGCSYSAINRRCVSEKWVEKRQKFHARVEKRAETKAVARVARKVKTLEELNDEAVKRVEALIAMNEQKIKEAIKKKTIKEKGQNFEIDFVDLSPRDLRTLQTNIIDLQHELRLHHNYDPDKPVEAKADNSNDDEVLDALFEHILGKPPEPEKKPDA